jgi:hypothetical protein
MIDFLYSLGFIVTFLIVWFQTDAFVEYCKVFGFKKILFNYEFSELTFPQYLYSKRNILCKTKISLFYIKLITCPVCLSFWLCLIAGTIINNFLIIPLLYVTSVFVYLVFSKLLNH